MTANNKANDLNLSEGQEFYAGGKRFIIRDGVPVQEEKRGVLGGNQKKLIDLKWIAHERVYIVGNICDNQPKSDSVHIAVNTDVGNGYLFLDCPGDFMVEINVPQPQAKGRVMTAGEAARLPDIVGKRVLMTVDCVDPGLDYPVRLIGFSGWMHHKKKIEVLD